MVSYGRRTHRDRVDLVAVLEADPRVHRAPGDHAVLTLDAPAGQGPQPPGLHVVAHQHHLDHLAGLRFVGRGDDATGAVEEFGLVSDEALHQSADAQLTSFVCQDLNRAPHPLQLRDDIKQNPLAALKVKVLDEVFPVLYLVKASQVVSRIALHECLLVVDEPDLFLAQPGIVGRVQRACYRELKCLGWVFRAD